MELLANEFDNPTHSHIQVPLTENHSKPLIIFSDLDGCLLNSNYVYSDAIPALEELREFEIPLVLASSKTEAEMMPLAEELGLTTPIICENGGIVSWRGQPGVEETHTILGIPREQILTLLESLHEKFQFRSFENLGISGIMESTGLSEAQAKRSATRMTNEPLIWDDAPERIEEFRQALENEKLTLTRGGRFWHIAGVTTKGKGMSAVLNAMQSDSGLEFQTAAVGDSPIDTSLLELADYPIVIPHTDGIAKISVDNPNQIIATQPESLGWNESILKLIQLTTNS